MQIQLSPSELEIIHKTGALLTDPAKHCTNFYARDAQGNVVYPNTEDACLFCALGAAMHFANVETRYGLSANLLRALAAPVPAYVKDPQWPGMVGRYWDTMTPEQRLTYASALAQFPETFET